MHLLRRPRGRLLLLGLIALVAVAIAVPALAREASESDAPAESSTDDDPPGERFGDARAAFAAALADELDLPVDRVEDALTAVRERLVEERRDERRAMLEQRLDDAVADGALTQEQADAILDAAEAGVLGGGRGHGMASAVPATIVPADGSVMTAARSAPRLRTRRLQIGHSRHRPAAARRTRRAAVSRWWMEWRRPERAP